MFINWRFGEKWKEVLDAIGDYLRVSRWVRHQEIQRNPYLYSKPMTVTPDTESMGYVAQSIYWPDVRVAGKTPFDAYVNFMLKHYEAYAVEKSLESGKD